MAHGYADDIDPEAFAVVNGKLYLNLTNGINNAFLRGVAGNIVSGDREWPRIKDLLIRKEKY